MVMSLFRFSFPSLFVMSSFKEAYVDNVWNHF